MKTLLAATLMLCTGLSLANPLDPYIQAYRENQSLVEQAYACGWAEPFAGLVTKVAATYTVDLADAKVGLGSTKKIRAAHSKAIKPCDSAEDRAMQARTMEVMFDWANRMGVMQVIMDREAWAKGLVDVSAGAQLLEPWRAGIQKQVIERNGAPAWENHLRQVQQESFQELALICAERATHNYKGKRACPKIPETLALALPLAKARVDNIEWLSPKLLEHKQLHERGANGSPYKFIDEDPSTLSIMASVNMMYGLRCEYADWVVYPAAHKPGADKTLPAVLRKYQLPGAFGTLKLKSDGGGYLMIESDKQARDLKVVQGRFQVCTEPAK